MQRLRYWLKRYVHWIRVPVRTGPLRGMWISVFCGVRFVRGTYDQGGVRAVVAMVERGMVVYDVGAHIGYLSMLAARLVGPAGLVVAFEPVRVNLRYLRGHVRANQLANIAIVDACVSNVPGVVSFDIGKGTGRGRAVPQGRGTTRSVAIDDEVFGKRLLAPHVIKLDVEGAEFEVLLGAEKTLRAFRPALLISVHSLQLEADCGTFLRSLGYEVTRIKSNQLTATAVGAAPGMAGLNTSSSCAQVHRA